MKEHGVITKFLEQMHQISAEQYYCYWCKIFAKINGKIDHDLTCAVAEAEWVRDAAWLSSDQEKAKKQLFDHFDCLENQCDGFCELCISEEFPYRNGELYEDQVTGEEGDEYENYDWRIDHEDNCPFSILENMRDEIEETK